MFCSIITADNTWTLWGVKSRKNWKDTLSDGFDSLFDIAAVGDDILLDTLDKYGYLKITALDEKTRTVTVVVTDELEWNVDSHNKKETR